MKTPELVFIGIRGFVVALNRATGGPVWQTRLRSADFVNVVVEGDSILAACYGEIYCLDPLSGKVLWHNPLKGFGTGLATIATSKGIGSGLAPILAEKRRREQEQAAAATAVVATS